MVAKVIYDSKFSKEELAKINFLRVIDNHLSLVSWSIGICALLLLYFSQLTLHDQSWINKVASYGCIPFGIVVGWCAKLILDRWIERSFIDKWDKLYKQRTGMSDMDIEIREAMIELTDSIDFLTLPDNQQKHLAEKRTNEIKQKYESNEVLQSTQLNLGRKK